MRHEFQVEGMRCGSCAARVEAALAKFGGVEAASVNFATRTATVTGHVRPTELDAYLTKMGYGVVWPGEAQTFSITTPPPTHILWMALVLATSEIILSMTLPSFVGKGFLELALSGVVVFGCGFDVWRQALKLLKHGGANMDTLIAMGTGAAYFYSLYLLIFTNSAHFYFESAAVIMAFVLLGRHLEERARHEAGKDLLSLAGSGTRMVTVVQSDGRRENVPLETLKSGDVFETGPGERVATDGVIVEAESDLDEAILTGESLPVTRGPGEQVIGGAVNVGSGALRIQATKLGHKTYLAQLMRLVTNAQADKPAIQKLADRVARYFVPAVLAIAMVTAFGWWMASGELASALIPAIAVLVIACPCALGLATPAAIMAGVSAGSRRHILMKTARVWEQGRRLDVLIVDKTGTLTMGKPRVEHVDVAGALNERELAAMVLAVQSASRHPLAQAMCGWAREFHSPPLQVRGFREIAGLGVSGEILWEGTWRRVAFGKETLSEERHPWPEASVDSKGQVFAHLDDKPMARFILSDAIRPHARATVDTLRKAGVLVVMASGDQESVAKHVALATGIEKVHAGLRPEDKLTLAREYQKDGHIVGMLGDGINDAPALAASDLSIAVGRASDVAAQVSDIWLPNGDIRLVADALALAKATHNVIRQNLGWAFLYNVLAIPFAALGYLSPMIASATMALSSVSVVANALRLRQGKV